MAKILFWPDIYKESGHWLPVVSLAQQLKAKGHTVAFMGIPDNEAIVQPYGLTFYPILEKFYPLGYTSENKVQDLSKRWRPEHLTPITNGLLDPVINGYAPDLLVSGYFTAIETLLIYYKYGLNFTITTTYLRHPEEDPAIHALQKLMGLPKPLALQLMEKVYTGDLASLTVDEFVRPLEEFTELIPCPKDFDFDHYQHMNNVVYIEPLVERTYVGTPPKLPDLPVGKEIIFATAGSMVHDYIHRARHFFLEMIKMMKGQGMQGYYLVLAVGPQFMEEDWGEIPSNVTKLAWVPQWDLLQKTSVAFIHGGLATLKESIYWGVPTVVIPLGKDQMENALRLHDKQIGITSNADSVDQDVLRNLLIRVRTDVWIKNNLDRMKALFRQIESEKPGVELIHSTLP